MIPAFRAELIKLWRPRTVLFGAAVVLLFALGSAAAGVLTAQPAGSAADGPTVETFARADGGTLAFTSAASFVGSFLLAVFAGAVGVEFSRGTFRTMLMRQPGRIRFLAGKMAALLLLVAVALAAATAASWVASLLFARAEGIDTTAWISWAGLRAALGDYGMVLLTVIGWAVLGMALGVGVPSVPVALGIGVGWAGPVEQVFGEAWSPAADWFPGLLLESLLDPDPGGPSSTRALVTVGAYCLIALVGTAVVIRRRDVTS